jgi:hypothetical protein
MYQPNSNKPELPEVNVEPLGDLMLDFLIDRDREEAFIDFKETMSIAKEAPFAKIAKDIFAFSNYGGGFILVGFKQKPKPKGKTEKSEEKEEKEEKKRTFLPVGLPDSFNIDQADLQSKFNSYSNSPIQLEYRELSRTIDGLTKKFAAIYIHPSTCVLKPVKKGFYLDNKGREKVAFEDGSILFRRGTQSIVASKEEAAWIQSRAEKKGYQLGVLGGQPDQVSETIYSNIFEVTKIPNVLWTASRKTEIWSRQNQSKRVSYEAVYAPWMNRIVTFNDISNPQIPLWDMVEPESVRMEELSAWLADDDKQRIITQLLNKELSFLARRLGLRQETRKTRFMKLKWLPKFYYACYGENRIETWTPRFRKSSNLTVAQRMWAQQLRRFIFWHVAVKARFTYLGQRLFLRLVPTLVITNDGKEVITEGTIITRLIYNRYNSSYFNSLLFWISRFAEDKENVALAQGKILVSAKPAESKVNVGILFDRPTAELVEEVPNVEILEEE